MSMTLEQEILLAFDESKFNRVPKGSEGGGRFAPKGGAAKGKKAAKSISGKVSGKISGHPSGVPINKSEDKNTDKKLKEIRKLHKEVKEAHSPETIVKHVVAGIAIESAYHKLKPKIKKAAVVAAQAMRDKFGTGTAKVVKAELVDEPITKSIGAGAKRAIQKRPGWKAIAERAKKIGGPAIKKATDLLMRTGKFTAKVALGAAPFLARAAASIGIFLATATTSQLILAGTLASATAYAVYRVHRNYKLKKEERRIEEVVKRLHAQYA